MWSEVGPGWHGLHELTLAANLLDLTEEHARASGLVRVERVHVAIGALAAVDEDALAFAFEVARRGTVAATAVLVIERVVAGAELRLKGLEGI